MAEIPKTTQAWEELLNAVEREPAKGVDTEFSGPLEAGGDYVDPLRCSLTGLSLAVPGRSWYVPIGHREGNAPRRRIDQVMGALAAQKGVLASHNAKAEILSLRRAGLAASPWRWACTQVGAYLACLESGDPGRPFALKPWAQNRLGMWLSDFESVAKGRDFSQLDPSDPVALQYACEDAEAALGVWGMVEPRLADFGLLETFWELEMPLMKLLAKLQVNGVGVDLAMLEELRDTWLGEQHQLEARWRGEFPGIKLQGPSLQNFWMLGDWPTHYAKGKPVELNDSGKGFSTERETLERMLPLMAEGSRGHLAATLKIRHSLLSKLTSTYTDSLIGIAESSLDGRLHVDIHQTNTRTGRLSCSYLQNIPTRSAEGALLRKAFVATKGRKMVGIDFSQIEPRYLAHLLGHGVLFDAYQAGDDMYLRMGARINRDRKTSKVVLLAIMYGIGPAKIARDLRISEAAAEELLEGAERDMPEVVALKERVWRACRQRGYVKTLSGRRRYLPDITSPRRGLRGSAERKAFNTPIQGGARDIMARAMLNVDALDIPDLMPTLQIHDEELFEHPEPTPEVLAAVENAFQTAAQLRVPLVAKPEVGLSWSETK